jgi:hypothetical protein
MLSITKDAKENIKKTSYETINSLMTKQEIQRAVEKNNRISESKLSILYKKYESIDTAYILVPGQSLNAYWGMGLGEFLKNKLVLGVKQTFNLNPEIFDFHIVNAGNLDKNSCKKSYESDTILMFEGDIATKQLFDDLRLNYDIWMDCIGIFNWGKSLSEDLNFEEWMLNKTPVRKWGPTIMYELGIFLPIHLGVKNVVVIGWDASGSYFYKNDEMTENSIKEHELVKKSIPYLLEWYKSKDTNIRLCSDSSILPIPKISLEEIIGI